MVLKFMLGWVRTILPSRFQFKFEKRSPNWGPRNLHKDQCDQAGEFCLAGVFQGKDEWDKEVQEGEAVAVMCEPCKSEVGAVNIR